jgi:secondary thiamine-phosphate synthase enzyme
MAAHARNILAGSSVTVPIGKSELRLGTWQGIYLWEHRTWAHRRSVVVTVLA